MELRDFVRETLKQIVDGVVAAQEATKEKDARVNPGQIAFVGSVLCETNMGPLSAQMVDFDISLTESTSGEAKAGIGVFFGSVGIGGQGKTETGANAMNRVKSSVPIVLPRPKT